jgi:hypothetical protein
MIDMLKPAVGLLVIFGIPAVIGGVMAAHRARSPLLWAMLSAVFPIFILVVYFKKPLREVPGHFRHCPACGEFQPWKYPACIYCKADFPGNVLQQ